MKLLTVVIPPFILTAVVNSTCFQLTSRSHYVSDSFPLFVATNAIINVPQEELSIDKASTVWRCINLRDNDSKNELFDREQKLLWISKRRKSKDFICDYWFVKHSSYLAVEAFYSSGS